MISPSVSDGFKAKRVAVFDGFKQDGFANVRSMHLREIK
jgi:hypothetical protein